MSTWNNAWQHPWGQPGGGLMSPAVPWSLGAPAGGPMQQQGPNYVGSMRSDSTGEGGGVQSGYSAPGDPNTATQTSQATKDRMRGSLTGSLAKNVATAGLKAGVGLGLGMPSSMVGPAAIGSLASPGAVGNVLGGAINATLGTTPQGAISKAIGNFAVPALAGMAFGPVGGLMGGMFGGVLADGAMDAMNARSEESLRDDMENKAGYFGGRVGFADMQSYADKANALNDKVADAIAKATAVANIAGVPAPSFNRRDVSTRGMEVGEPGSRSYGGWGNVGGPTGGARAVDRGYGANMGGFAGLGIGNPSSYGGGGNSSNGGSGGRSSGGGYGGHAGGKDGSSTGFGR